MSRSFSRRGFLRLGAGAASFAVVSGLGIIGPRKAHAVIGIDDAALGGLVLLVATLGGYTLSRTVANVSLDSLGYGFSDFVSDSGNQAAAVTQAIADANNLGLELNRSNAENAAQSIAAGTGYFAEVMGNAATSGRVALDNFISGAGELPGVLRNLVGNFIQQKTSASGANLLPGCTGSDYISNDISYDSLTANNSGTVIAKNLDVMASENNVELNGAAWFIRADCKNSFGSRSTILLWGAGTISVAISEGGKYVDVRATDGGRFNYQYKDSASTGRVTQVSMTTIGWNPAGNGDEVSYQISGSLINGGALPVVDRAADAPDVIGPGYDSLPLANDLVIDPSTDEVVSAGSLPLPTSIPDVFGDYVGTLNDILAGVIPGQISLPVSVAEPVVVGTAEGVQSMSITDAIAGDTSLSASINPPVDPYPPYDPVEPPVDVPEGPWTPAVSLPFERIWPFNMIYSFVELFEQLGGS